MRDVRGYPQHSSSSLKPRPLLRLSSKRTERRLRLNIPTREPSIDFHIAIANNPLLLVNIPIAEIAPHKWELHSLALARLQENFLESAQDFDGSHVLVGGLREAEVELWDRSAGHLACV